MRDQQRARRDLAIRGQALDRGRIVGSERTQHEALGGEGGARHSKWGRGVARPHELYCFFSSGFGAAAAAGIVNIAASTFGFSSIFSMVMACPPIPSLPFTWLSIE